MFQVSLGHYFCLAATFQLLLSFCAVSIAALIVVVFIVVVASAVAAAVAAAVAPVAFI